MANITWQTRFIGILYSILKALGFPALVVYFLGRALRDRRYFRHILERFGRVRFPSLRTVPGSIWLHAVSVGEVISAVRLVEELRGRLPDTPVWLSTTTLAGRAIAEDKLAGLVAGVFYAPIDYAFAVRRVLDRLRPAALVVLETEIWPTLYRETKRAGASVVIVNGRISDRALPRYRRFRFMFRAALCNADAILVQSPRERDRYIDIGAPPERVQVLGNLKFDAAPQNATPPWAVCDFVERLRPDELWIAASTMPPANSSDVDEDDAVIEAFQRLSAAHPGLLTIIAPRKPERFDVVAEKLRSGGIRFERRSRLAGESDLQLPGVLLVDSIGELASLFMLADVVFMGGTLARRGGHNILEPAFASKPIIVGPHMENFGAICEVFDSAGALCRIAGPAELAGAVDGLLRDPQQRRKLGMNAQAAAEANRGVTARAVEQIAHWHDLAVPRSRRTTMFDPLLRALALGWRVGDAWRRARDRKHQRRLATPVVSVGNITTGGVGKTPFAIYLAELLNSDSAILTRGYRRQSVDTAILVPKGRRVPISITGDEAQILVRRAVAHVGIGADRWRTGNAIEEKMHPGCFILDDGFQHRRLWRDVDIVLIDATNPFGDGALVPLGSLREPLPEVARAHAFVITRACRNRTYAGIRGRLAQYNPAAPVFRGTSRPAGWLDWQTGAPVEQPAGPVLAFCGLGNPAAFWHTLGELGVHPAATWTFGDHHHYRQAEIRRLAALAARRGATVLVTTEKDAVNMPANTLALTRGMPVRYLKIEWEMFEDNGFRTWLSAALAKT